MGHFPDNYLERIEVSKGISDQRSSVVHFCIGQQYVVSERTDQEEEEEAWGSYPPFYQSSTGGGEAKTAWESLFYPAPFGCLIIWVSWIEAPGLEGAFCQSYQHYCSC